MTRARLTILLLLTFLVGLGAGMLAGGRIWHARWRYWRTHAKDIVLQKMDRDLVLTADQRQKIDAILTGRRDDIRALREEFRQKVRIVRDRSMSEVRPLLTAAQLPRFETIMAEYDARWRTFRGDPEPSPSPPPSPLGGEGERVRGR